MASSIDPAARRRWPAAILLTLLPLALAALVLSPMLATGYLADDVVSSLLPGMMRATGEGFAARTLGAIRHSIEGGRFYPLVWIEYTAAFTILRDVVAYKAAILAGVLLDLALLIALVRRLGGGTGLASLAAIATSGLFQFRVFFDPILSFHGLLQVVTAGVLLSLIALLAALDGKGRGWLVVSVGLYLGCLLTYEVTYPLFLLHAALIWGRRPGYRERIVTILPFALLAFACAGASALVRMRYPTDAYIHDVDLGPGSVALALAKQCSAALPLSAFVADPSGIFHDVRDPSAIVRWLGRGDVVLVALLAGSGAIAALRRARSEIADRRPGTRVLLATLGLALAVLPGALIAVSGRYQGEIGWGQGYLPVYMQCFGAGLLIASCLDIFMESVRRRGRSGRWASAALALAFGVSAGLTLRANERTAFCLIAPPGSRRFNAATGGMGGSYHAQRRTIEAAIGAGLLDRVPSGAALLLEHSYPDWHDATYAPFFYRTYQGRPFAVAPRPPEVDGIDAFVLRDRVVGLEVGSVLLRRTGGDRAVRLFVRHPGLGRPDDRPVFAVVVGPRLGIGPGGLDEVRSGEGWALYDLDPAAVGPDPDAIRVVFAPKGIAEALDAGRLAAEGGRPLQ